jgi:vanillate/4-hydroxybenzoate decarboxylase subunit D
MPDCPRCTHPQTRQLARSSQPGGWTVHACPACQFSWRTSEPFTTDPRGYPPAFRLTADQIAAAHDVPAIPSRRR